MTYESLKSFTRKELKDLVRELQKESDSQKETVALFYEENKILKIEHYDLNKKLESLETTNNEFEKEFYTINDRLDQIVEILTQETQNPLETIQKV